MRTAPGKPAHRFTEGWTLIEFTHDGIAYTAWYALNERDTRRVLRVRTAGRPTREQYANARERAVELLGDDDVAHQTA